MRKFSKKMFGILLFPLFFQIVTSVSSQCSMVDVKSLLEGCDRLLGLNVTSIGGTMVNDHNCDVLLPKQVFAEEPLFQYALADSKKFYTIIMVDPDAPPQIDGEFYLHMLKSNIPYLTVSGPCCSWTSVMNTKRLEYYLRTKLKCLGEIYMSSLPRPSNENIHSAADIFRGKVFMMTFSDKMTQQLYFNISDKGKPGLALKAKETSKTVGIDYRGYKPPTPPRGTGPHRYISLLYEQADGNNFLPTVPTSRGRFVLANWLRGKNLCGPVASTQFRVQF